MTAPCGTVYTPVGKNKIKNYPFKLMLPVLIILTFGQQKCETNAPSLFERLTGKLHHRVLSMHSFELQVYGNLLTILGMHKQCEPGYFSHVRLSVHTFSSSQFSLKRLYVCFYVETDCFALFNINYVILLLHFMGEETHLPSYSHPLLVC